MNSVTSTIKREDGNGNNNADSGDRKLTYSMVIKDLYKYADGSMTEPDYDMIAARLNAYLIVDALLIALLVTLLPTSRATLTVAFTWTEEDWTYWNATAFTSFTMFGDPKASIEFTVRCWAVSMSCLMASFVIAMFTYVNLLGSRRSRLLPWYKRFTVAVTISLWSLIFGIMSFFLNCMMFVQVMGGAFGVSTFLGALIGIVVPITLYAVLAPFVTAFVNVGLWN